MSLKITFETSSSKKLRVLVDANVLVAGTGWPRFPYEVLQHAVKGDFQLVLAPIVIEEARKHTERLFPQLMPQLDNVLEASHYELTEVVPPPEVAVSLDLARDIKDVPIVLSAIKAQVDYLVTQDKDLTEPNEPVHQYVRVLLPGTFLREHLGWTSEALEAIRQRKWSDLDVRSDE